MPESGKAGRRRRMHWSARHPRPAPQLPRCERRAKRRTCGTSWKRRASVTQGLHRVTHSALGASLNGDLHVVLAVEPPDDKHERSHSPHLPPVGEDQLHTCPPLALTCGHGACAKTRTRRVLRRGPKKRGVAGVVRFSVGWTVRAGAGKPRWRRSQQPGQGRSSRCRKLPEWPVFAVSDGLLGWRHRDLEVLSGDALGSTWRVATISARPSPTGMWPPRTSLPFSGPSITLANPRAAAGSL